MYYLIYPEMTLEIEFQKKKKLQHNPRIKINKNALSSVLFLTIIVMLSQTKR